ncbi:PLP-dependent transferase [Mollisia scopiformis]|uniref:PLP-dependent transferase n=1 Tax=Mollisia scopiformis TaxID=149040 RepID=A0A132B650_MOLSC|nr:PLP-dependent transferase [Mollisia scopiformis]KUJ07885.1 PLP-dependent transferase [Mollisia scopiformis]
MAYNSDVDEFQATEYPMLEGKTYLDHGGATIYAKSLIETVSADLISNLYGNPHSASDPAMLSGQLVDETREKTLRFFGADPEHFDLIFVANATAAIKLVMESFKDIGNAAKADDASSDGAFRYFYHVDCHNSVIGVRETTDNNFHCFPSDAEVEEWVDGRGKQARRNRLGLFAYPGQSNMTGRRLPLSWPGRLRRSTHDAHQDTFTLFDAAALATTAPLNNVFADPDSAPDFTALSFYKIFGYPDLGGLIVRKSSGNILRWGRNYFGGGTVEVVVVMGNKPWYEGRKTLHSSLEDGTLPFHSIIALNAEIDTHDRLYGPEPMKRISKHATFLGKKLYDAMSSLVYSTGVPVVKIYNDNPEFLYGNPSLQGATVAFNVRTPQGAYIPYTSVVESLANEKKIFVRAGTLCNPGGIATYLGYDPIHIKKLWEDGHRCSSAATTCSEVLGNRPTGVVRVSLGAMTTMANVDRFIDFLKEEFMSGALGTYDRNRSFPPSYVSDSRPATRTPSVDTTATNYESYRPTAPSRRAPIPIPTAQQTEAIRADFESILSFQQTVEPEVFEVETEKKGLKNLWKSKTRKHSSVSVGA